MAKAGASDERDGEEDKGDTDTLVVEQEIGQCGEAERRCEFDRQQAAVLGLDFGKRSREACHVESCVKCWRGEHDGRSCNSARRFLQAFRNLMQNVCRRIFALELRQSH